MRIVVTGATGFIGRHFVERALAGGHEVVALYRPGSPGGEAVAGKLRARGAELHAGDIGDPDSLARAMLGADCVCHFAAAFREAGVTDDYFRAVNIAGTRHAVDAAASQGVRRFVMCGTAGIYGSRRPGITDESAPVNPVNIYEASKVEAEEAVRRQSSAHGIEYAILRPAVVYGPHDKRLFKMFSAAARGRFPLFGAGRGRRHMVYVGDVAEAALRLCTMPSAAGAEVIVAGPRAAPLAEILEVLARVVGRKSTGPRLPLGPVLLLAGAIEDAWNLVGAKPPIYRRRMDFYRNDAAFDCSRAERLLGWKPEVDLEEGFRRTFESYCETGRIRKPDGKARRLMASLPVALTLAFAIAGAAEAELDRRERAIAAHAAAGQPEAESLLARVVDIASPTEDLEGVRAAGEVFAEELRAIGFETRWIELPAGMKRAGHLLAETGGRRGKRLLLLGHLDTVLAGERFRREGTRAYGTGTADMKGGVVVMLQALKALHAAGALRDRRITVLLTGDEEDAGAPLSVSRASMLELAGRSDAALSFEAAIDGTATIGRRGINSWTLEVSGETGHSSGIFGERRGSGAVFEAARILAAFQAELGSEKYLTINPSIVVGGTTASLDDYRGSAEGKTNVIAPIAIARGDFRYISLEQERSARERMQAIVARHLPRTRATLRFDEGAYPPMTPTPGNEELLGVLDGASRDLGLGPVTALDPAERGAGDIGFVAHLLPSLDGLGSGGGGNSHAPGEYTDLATLTPMAQRAAVLMYRLTR
jgi:glutamate carboxypeptidase